MAKSFVATGTPFGLLLSLLIILGSTAEAATFRVNCDEGESIQQRLDKNAKNGDTVEVSGLCQEQIVIETNNLQLIGLNSATIDGGGDAGPGNTVIQVRALNVTITGFTVTGGRSGIFVSRVGSALIEGNIIIDVGRNGISVTDGAWGRIDNNMIMDIPRSGIVLSGGGADLSGNDVRRARDGLFVTSSRVDFDGPNIFLENSRDGIRCQQLGAMRNTSTQTVIDPTNPANNNGGLPVNDADGTCSCSGITCQ